ncbi:MAG: cell division protein FtsX [Campylobacterota bacterium]|nr:cell division protein FtsX [Campylobacterota bacterium]
MKSIRNHLSLIIALATILFTIQVYMIIDRSITAYETNLKNDYSIIIVTKKELKADLFKEIDKRIERAEEIQPDHVIKSLKGQMKAKNIELLKLTLPKFYRVHLDHYPTPDEISKINANLLKHPLITRVEDFAQNHDLVYKLLLLYKKVSTIFALVIFAVTTLLILKELKIWQLQHSERMSIMALFGAPIWLRSAVLYRLATVDAIIASLLINGAFFLLLQYQWIEQQLNTIGISIEIYTPLNDGLILTTIALSLSLLLATLVIMGHKEEV